MRLARLLLAAMLALWPASLVSSQQPSKIELEGKTEIIKVERIVRVFDDRLSVVEFPFKLKVPAGAIRPQWSVPAGVTFIRKGSAIEVTAAPKGELKIFADWGVFNKEKLEFTDDSETITLLIGGASPPVPLPPDIKPLPPEPKPPVPVAGLRVLVVAEATQGALLLTAKQSNELYGTAMADYAKAKFAKGPDGTAEFRRFDKDIDPSQLNQVWRQFFEDWRTNANGVVPWIVISDGQRGFSGPLPDGGVLDLVKKYGG